MILTVKDLSVSYGAITALRGISLHVEKGHIVTLIGANGAGKTTLLRSISGLLRPRSGSITYQPGGHATVTEKQSIVSPQEQPRVDYAGLPAHDLTKLSPHEIVGLGVIHVPEGRGIFANLTVAENLRLGAYLRHDTAEIDKDRERVLTTFPRLKERYKQSAGTLSGGEQQMLAIGRGLMARPTLLLLDEPSLGLAPRLVRQIFETIVEINRQGVTILLIEQNAHMALNVAHHAFCLETGTIALSGPARELAAKDEVKQVYLGG